MRKVKFLQDYRGKLSAEIFYQAGDEAEFEDAVAEALVEAERAEYSDGGKAKPAPAVPKQPVKDD